MSNTENNVSIANGRMLKKFLKDRGKVAHLPGPDDNQLTNANFKVLNLKTVKDPRGRFNTMALVEIDTQPGLAKEYRPLGRFIRRRIRFMRIDLEHAFELAGFKRNAVNAFLIGRTDTLDNVIEAIDEALTIDEDDVNFVSVKPELASLVARRDSLGYTGRVSIATENKDNLIDFTDAYISPDADGIAHVKGVIYERKSYLVVKPKLNVSFSGEVYLTLRIPSFEDRFFKLPSVTFTDDVRVIIPLPTFNDVGWQPGASIEINIGSEDKKYRCITVPFYLGEPDVVAIVDIEGEQQITDFTKTYEYKFTVSDINEDPIPVTALELKLTPETFIEEKQIISIADCVVSVKFKEPPGDRRLDIGIRVNEEETFAEFPIRLITDHWVTSETAFKELYLSSDSAGFDRVTSVKNGEDVYFNIVPDITEKLKTEVWFYVDGRGERAASLTLMPGEKYSVKANVGVLDAGKHYYSFTIMDRQTSVVQSHTFETLVTVESLTILNKGQVEVLDESPITIHYEAFDHAGNKIKSSDVYSYVDSPVGVVKKIAGIDVDASAIDVIFDVTKLTDVNCSLELKLDNGKDTWTSKDAEVTNVVKVTGQFYLDNEGMFPVGDTLVAEEPYYLGIDVIENNRPVMGTVFAFPNGFTDYQIGTVTVPLAGKRVFTEKFRTYIPEQTGAGIRVYFGKPDRQEISYITDINIFYPSNLPMVLQGTKVELLSVKSLNGVDQGGKIYRNRTNVLYFKADDRNIRRVGITGTPISGNPLNVIARSNSGNQFTVEYLATDVPNYSSVKFQAYGKDESKPWDVATVEVTNPPLDIPREVHIFDEAGNEVPQTTALEIGKSYTVKMPLTDFEQSFNGVIYIFAGTATISLERGGFYKGRALEFPITLLNNDQGICGPLIVQVKEDAEGRSENIRKQSINVGTLASIEFSGAMDGQNQGQSAMFTYKALNTVGQTILFEFEKTSIELDRPELLQFDPGSFNGNTIRAWFNLSAQEEAVKVTMKYPGGSKTIDFTIPAKVS